MGARWAWYARCEAGHIFSNFSGGSDGVCDAVEGCNAAVDCEIQCPHMFDEEPCDCEKYLESRMDKRPVDPCPDCTALRTRLAEVEGALRPLADRADAPAHECDGSRTHGGSELVLVNRAKLEAARAALGERSR